ncbi:MAG TPA: helix-turn-helix domain-containing protein [Gemmataceae bacterium]|nr:helix-turn-helix domain-containing protein [Gemmataceae bacterium]
MENLPAIPNVLDQELIRQIMALPPTWLNISPEAMASSADEALDKLVVSGLAEARLHCWLQLNIRPKWYEFWKPAFESMHLRFRILGDYRLDLMRAIAQAMPRHWQRDDRLVSDVDLRVGNFDQIHLTSDGEMAQQAVRQGAIAHFLEFVKAVRIKPQIRLEEKEVNEGKVGNESPKAVAVAHASAHVDNTVHIHMGDVVNQIRDLLKDINPPATNATISDPICLTVTEAARYIGVSDRTIREWRQSGKLPSEETGDGKILFSKSTLEFFKATRSV